MGKHVVVGHGAVGTTLAGVLAERGNDVVVVSRTGAGPHEVTGVRHVATDASDPVALAAAARGAEVIYNCANPRYSRWATDWPPLHDAFLDAAEATGAVLVTTSNLYGYGPGSGVMREDTPLASTETKGRVRAAMWRTAKARHDAGRVRATEVRASDYAGPLATQEAHYGTRLVSPLLAGKALRPVGDPDQPHSVVYLPDLARALAAAGTTEAAWGKPWLAPTLPATTYRETARLFAAAAGLPEPRISPAPPGLIALLGLFSPDLREVRGVSYQFTEPFVADSSVSEQVLGLRPTAWDTIAQETVAWWRGLASRHDATRTGAPGR